ncbi:hypothetical protein NKH77_30860 [Streptomyces sp. M19]
MNSRIQDPSAKTIRTSASIALYGIRRASVTMSRGTDQSSRAFSGRPEGIARNTVRPSDTASSTLMPSGRLSGSSCHGTVRATAPGAAHITGKSSTSFSGSSDLPLSGTPRKEIRTPR